jgi:hypothetical protein
MHTRFGHLIKAVIYGGFFYLVVLVVSLYLSSDFHVVDRGSKGLA